MPICPYWTGFTNTTAYHSPFTGKSSASGSGMLFHLQRQLTIADCTMAIDPAPGAGKSQWIRFCEGAGGSGNFEGNAVTVTGAGISTVRTDVEGTLTAAADNSLTEGYYIHTEDTGSPGNAWGVVAFIYEDASPDVNYYGWGDLFTTDLLSGVAAGTSAYITFGVTGASTSTEADVQTPWPADGHFQFARGAKAVAAGKGDVTVVLRKNGADTALSMTASEGAGTISDTTNVVSVSAGDLISWRFVQAAPAGSFQCAMMCGFIAS